MVVSECTVAGTAVRVLLVPPCNTPEKGLRFDANSGSGSHMWRWNSPQEHVPLPAKHTTYSAQHQHQQVVVGHYVLVHATLARHIGLA